MGRNRHRDPSRIARATDRLRELTSPDSKSEEWDVADLRKSMREALCELGNALEDALCSFSGDVQQSAISDQVLNIPRNP